VSARFRFCPRCATPLADGDIDGRTRQYCPACGFVHYRNPLPVAGCVVALDGGVVLIRRGGEPRRGYWALPAGYVECDETVEEAARRETREECGLDVELLGLLGVYSFVHPTEPRAGVGLYYLARRVGGRLAPGDDAVEARVFVPTEIPGELAFSSHAAAIAAWRSAPRGLMPSVE
jgi:ADP-ribose pyrophosphatase YjhB (NUDIX family)